MLHFAVDLVLLDIEGTTSPVDFVYRILFPFARKRMDEFLRATRNEPTTRDACKQLARDIDRVDLVEQIDSSIDQALPELTKEALALMDVDSKTTGLKEIQGLIWKQGYTSGALRSQLFSDVPAALQRWTDDGLKVAIYSSGSSTAQEVFFQHTEFGDLTKFLVGFYDTTFGAKREIESYKAIARHLQIDTEHILFVSDVGAELQAARQSGMSTVLCIRSGYKPSEGDDQFAPVNSFDEMRIRKVTT